MGLFNTYITVVEEPKHNKTNDIKTQSRNGYDAVREKPDEHNTLIVSQPVVVNGKCKKLSIGLN